MRMYLVYDTKDNDLFVMRGTAKRIAGELETTPKKVRDYARQGNLLKRRYKVVRDYE